MDGIKGICRECGALCLPRGWAERGGLCGTCAFPPAQRIAESLGVRGPVESVQRVYVNGVEVVGAEAIEAALRARDSLPVYDPQNGRTSTVRDMLAERDPIRDAIDRAAADWARDNPEDA